LTKKFEKFLGEKKNPVNLTLFIWIKYAKFLNIKKLKKGGKKTIPPRKTTNEVGTSNFFSNFLVWKFW
jgi:hypothetical protein